MAGDQIVSTLGNGASRMVAEIQVRTWMVDQGADPELVLSEASYPVDLFEDVTGSKLMRDWSPEGRNQNRFIIYHPEKGMLGAITLSPHDHHDITKATRAGMAINTFENPDAVDDVRPETRTKTGKTTHGHTMMGPSYAAGPAAVRQALRHIKSVFPNLKRIDNSTRVTGVKTDHSGQFNLERGAGALRGVQAVQRGAAGLGRSRAAFQPPSDFHSPNSTSNDAYGAVLRHHGWNLEPSGWRHPEHGRIRGFGDEGTGWEHIDSQGDSVENGYTSGGLDSHLTDYHNHHDAMGTPNHRDFYHRTAFPSLPPDLAQRYSDVLEHHGFQHQTDMEDFQHWHHGRDDFAVRVHNNGNWKVYDEEGELDQEGIHPQTLDNHLSMVSGHPTWHSQEHGRNTLRGEYKSVLSHHGWFEREIPEGPQNRGGTVISHPDHLGHSITFNGVTGGWQHHNDDDVDPDTGEVKVVDHGTNPADLDAHLDQFHGHGAFEPEQNHLPRYRQVLQHHGWNVLQSGLNAEHRNYPGHGIVIGRGGWAHANADQSIAREVGHGTPESLDQHLASGYSSASQRFFGSHPPEVLHMHNELRRRGWEPGEIHGVHDQETSGWRHSEHPDHEVHVQHQGTPNLDPGFEVVNSNGRTVHSGESSEISDILDNWYPTSAATGRRRPGPTNIPTHGTSPTSIPTHSQAPYHEGRPEVREMHQELQSRGWRTSPMGPESEFREHHPEMSMWRHSDHPDARIHVWHQPDEDGDVMFRHYKDSTGEIVHGETHQQLGRYLTALSNQGSERRAEQRRQKDVLMSHGYEPGTGTLVHHFQHPQTGHTAILHTDGTWSHNSPDFPDQTGHWASQLDQHLGEIHGPNNKAYTSFRRELRNRGYEHNPEASNSVGNASGPESEVWQHPGTGHFARLEDGDWIHRRHDSSHAVSGSDPAELRRRLIDTHAPGDMQELLMNRGWERMGSMTSTYHPGGPVWYSPDNPHWGMVHINQHAGQPGHEQEAHWTHHPSRTHRPNDSPTHGQADQLQFHISHMPAEGSDEVAESNMTNTDELYERIMETGNVDLLDEGFFGDMFRKGVGKALGPIRQRLGGFGGPRRLGPSVELMPGPKMLGPGPSVKQLSGGVNVSMHPHSAYAASRMLPAPSPKLDDKHPIIHELNYRDYQHEGSYTHPEGGSFSVWMKHATHHGRRSSYKSTQPDDNFGQVHVEHDPATGHPTGNWHYFHSPEQHAWHGYPDRFQVHPEDHGTLPHPENGSDFDNYSAAEHVSDWLKQHPKHPHDVSASGLAHLLDDVDEVHPSNAHTGGRYASEEEGDLQQHGWRHAYDNNEGGNEKYEFMNDPASVYTNDDDKRLKDHELHLHASGRWSHFNQHGEKVASHEDGGELGWHLKHGIDDALGASAHDADDEEEDFPDHE